MSHIIPSLLRERGAQSGLNYVDSLCASRQVGSSLSGTGNSAFTRSTWNSDKNWGDAETEIIPVIGDVQDRERMFDMVQMYEPKIIYHAAAHKHVPLMEFNPSEAVKNNVIGTKNVAEAADANHVDTFVLVSTDKAVNPTNVMGATKRVAEMIVQGLNAGSD